MHERMIRFRRLASFMIVVIEKTASRRSSAEYSTDSCSMYIWLYNKSIRISRFFTLRICMCLSCIVFRLYLVLSMSLLPVPCREASIQPQLSNEAAHTHHTFREEGQRVCCLLREGESYCCHYITRELGCCLHQVGKRSNS